MQELLLEVGTEEIPAGYLSKALDEFKSLMSSALTENSIKISGQILTLGTPRRLILVADGLADSQDDVEEEITGPPAAIAFDSNGSPTKAAIGFAEKQGISVGSLSSIETPKGTYLYLKRTIKGKSTCDVLASVLPNILAEISWPKSMRWGEIKASFVRPVHWVVAILNGKTIPFYFCGVTSGNVTRGHRFMAPDKIHISSAEEYFKALENTKVITNISKREEITWDLIKQEAEKAGGSSKKDQDLLHTVANLVEYPSVVCGQFDESFLKLPEAVIITPMKEHQKYFPVYDSNGHLMPRFIAVNNTIARNTGVVRRGHERVLRARLSDASFFFEEDMKKTLISRLDALKNVIYHAEIGTSYAKVMRFKKIALWLGNFICPDKLSEIEKAAELAKCDLITGMVGEFPSLQGIMGMEYARREGWADEICMAIRDHYLPSHAGGELPETAIGAIISLAARMDTITGYFAINQEPSGSADPFALRRHALAILRILADKGWDISLQDFIKKSADIIAEDIIPKTDDLVRKVYDFFKDRGKFTLLREGFDQESVEAVFSVPADSIRHLRPKIEDISRFRSEGIPFQNVVLSYKRINNMLKKQTVAFEVESGLFADPCERILWEHCLETSAKVKDLIGSGAYLQACNALSDMTPYINVFFDTVEILVKDNEAVRNNRVGILQALLSTLNLIADFSKFTS